MKLEYGKEEIRLPIQNKNIIKVLNLKEQEALLNPENKLKELMKNPINSSSLKDLVNRKKARRF